MAGVPEKGPRRAAPHGHGPGDGRGPHLIERAAARLRAEAGLAPPEPGLEPAPGTDAPPPVPAPPRRVPAEAAAAPPAEQAAAHAAAAPSDTALLEPPARPDHDAGMEPGPDEMGGGYLDMATLKRAGLALAGTRSRVTEEYRITVGRILRSLRASTRNSSSSLIMITSARPGEGKSFSALNIAASISQNGLSDVILVDVDGKPRSMTTLLGLRDRQGLLDLVETPGLQPEDLLVRTAVEGLSVMPLGLNRSATAEGGVTRAVLAAMERVRRRFSHHILLLDTAPCLSTSDPSTLAPLVDQVVMVVEAGRTQRSELGASLELVKSCPNLILVLNKVRLTHSHSFGSYYYFGYPS